MVVRDLARRLLHAPVVCPRLALLGLGARRSGPECATVGAEGALETALALMGSGPERATVEEREEGGWRSLSTKTKSHVDEAIVRYAATAIELLLT